MARDLQPGPFEPAGTLGEALRGRPWIPLVHAAGVEHQRAVASFHVRPVCVAENYRVCAAKAPEEGPRQTGVGMQVAQAERPQQRLRFLDQTASVAMNQDDPPALDQDLPAGRQVQQRTIVIPAHRFDRGDLLELRDGLCAVDVARMEDEVDPAQDLEDSVWQSLEEFRAVGIGDHADAGRQAGVGGGAGPGRSVNSTTNGARLSTAAIANISIWPLPKAAAPMSGPITPPM